MNRKDPPPANAPTGLWALPYEPPTLEMRVAALEAAFSKLEKILTDIHAEVRWIADCVEILRKSGLLHFRNFPERS